MPHGPCPAQTHSPRRPGTRPTSGRPSALSGRAQARTPRIGASATPGTKVAARRQDRLDPRGWVRLLIQERRADGGHAGQRDEAEVGLDVGCRPGADLGPDLRPDLGPDLGLLDDLVRTMRQVGLDDDAPALADRRPPAGRVDDRGRPWTGRHQDRVAGDPPTIDDDPDDLVADAGRGRPSGRAERSRHGARRGWRRRRSRRPAGTG